MPDLLAGLDVLLLILAALCGGVLGTMVFSKWCAWAESGACESFYTAYSWSFWSTALMSLVVAFLRGWFDA